MIETRIGNVLDVPEGIIVHGCNCLGIMNSGIAREIRDRFPEAYNVYRQEFERSNGLKLGNISYTEVSYRKFIINANTQNNIGIGNRRVSYDAITECFEKVVKMTRLISDNYDTSLDIVFPMIGSGLDGGNWNIIQVLIDETVPDEFKKILYTLN